MLGTGVGLALFLLAPGAPPPGGERVPGAAPGITVVPADFACDIRWLAPPGSPIPASVPDFGDERLRLGWLRHNDLAFSGAATARVTVRAGATAPARIDRIAVEVERRAPAFTGAERRVLVQSAPCDAGMRGSGAFPAQVAVGLDPLPEGGGRPVDGAAGFPLPRSVPAGERFVFEIKGVTVRHDVRWRATVTWWDGERSRTRTVDHHGRPFRVAPVAPAASAAHGGPA